jgi:UDP-N-acetylglucosamine--dolichyl-phosphate N-acetylglucosaminephosphotransferase|tara:strand:- start:335 stop:1327 length:993 start_codon:yes stop_codon:yes gene_type:complete
MNYLSLIPVLVSFFISFLSLPYWIKKCKSIGLVWEDMNKFGRPKNVASSGGIVVVMSFVLGVMSYVALKTFIFGETVKALEIFSLLSVILIFGIIGLVDDLLGWKNGGLSNKIRLLLAFVASVPLVVINAGVHNVNLPLLGLIDLGILYPLILIPLGVVGASTTFNFLAGFNGLEAGQGILILSFLSFVSYSTGSTWLGIIGLCMVGALLGFYLLNKFPAKVFPGDIMTYAIGALIACMAILGNFEKIAIIVFIPYIIEVILKIRGRLKKYSFGIPRKDGTLKMPYNKIYGLEHLAIKILNRFGGATEKKVVYLIYIFQLTFILLGIWMM